MREERMRDEYLLLVMTSLNNSVINSSANDTAAVRQVVLIPNAPFWFSNYLIYILGFFHVILSLWMVAEYYVREAPNLCLRIPLMSKFL